MARVGPQRHRKKNYLLKCVREVATAYEILVERSKGKRHFLDAGLDSRMILKCTLNKCGERSGLDSITHGHAQ